MFSFAQASIPLDNIPPANQFAPYNYCSETFHPHLATTGVNTLSKANLKTNWTEYYGQEHFLRARQLVPVPLQPPQSTLWIWGIVFLCLSGFAYLRLNYPYKTNMLFNAAASIRHFNLLRREGGYFKEVTTWILFGVFVLVFSLFIFKSLLQLNILSNDLHIENYLIYLIVLAGVIAFFISKAIITGYLAWLFRNNETNIAYHSNIFLLNNIIGLALLPLVTFNIHNPSESIIIAGWVIWLIINIVKLYRAILIGKTQPRFQTYYFILYFCTIEIIPLLLIARLIGIGLLPT